MTAPVPLGPLPRKTGSRLGDRHLRPLRGGLGRDPVPPLVPSQWGSGNRATVSPHWCDSLWCGPAVPHCARPSGYSSGAPVRGGRCRNYVSDPQGDGHGGEAGVEPPAESLGVVQGASPIAESCQVLPGTPQGVQGAATSSWGPMGPGSGWDRAASGPMGLDGHRPTLSPWVKYPRFFNARVPGVTPGGPMGLVWRATTKISINYFFILFRFWRIFHNSECLVYMSSYFEYFCIAVN